MKYKIFLVYIPTFGIDMDDQMYPLKKAQIAYLKVENAFIKVPSKYANFAYVFLIKLVIKLFIIQELTILPLK